MFLHMPSAIKCPSPNYTFCHQQVMMPVAKRRVGGLKIAKYQASELKNMRAKVMHRDPSTLAVHSQPLPGMQWARNQSLTFCNRLYP